MSRTLVSRRNLVLISLGLLVLAAATAVLAPKRARADEGRPIKGIFTAAFSVTPNTGESFCGGASSGNAVEAHGGGNSTLGALSLSLQKTIVGTVMHGCLTLTAPNGDTLSAIYDGTQQGMPNANNFRDATGTLTFTGGTGRFEGASGSADFTAVFSRIGGTANPIQGIAFYSVEGALSLQDNQ
jgi:hypothetical protein